MSVTSVPGGDGAGGERCVRLSVSQWDAVSSHLEGIQAFFDVRLCVRVQRSPSTSPELRKRREDEPTILVSISGSDGQCVGRAEEFVASICSSVLMSDGVTSGTSATPGVAHGAIGCHLSPPLSPRSSQPSLTASKPPSPTLFAGLMMNTPSAFSSYMHSSSTSSLFSSEDVMGALDGPERELIRRYKSRQQQRLSLERIDPQALLYGSVLPPELTIVTSTAGTIDDDTCVTGGDCGPCSTPTSSVTYVLASSTSRPVVSTSLSSGSSTGLLGYSVVPSSSAYAAGVVTSTLSLDGKRPCRKLESEDSCYETDREDGAEVSPSSSTSVSTAVASPSSNLFGSATAAAFFGRSGGVFHDDLDRTLSETLGREFQEYVTLGSSAFTRGQSSGSGSSESLVSPPQHHQLVPTTSSVSTSTPASSGVPTSEPNYTAKLEFALKLGYTERQVQIAFARLGSTNPTQNELLEELIKVSTTPGLCGPSVDSDDIFGSNDDAESLPVIPSGHGRSSLSVAFLASKDSGNLRHIVIDGSNVAMSHGNKEVFSCRGIRLAVDWFKARGHQEITVFVPKWRKESSTPDAPIRDQEILLDLERERILVFTPSRLIGGRRLICYDDRYILKLAVETDGVVVSNDNYRDLAQENPEFKKLVEERILMFSFVNDRFMPPDDPLGRNGPSLSTFLRKPHTPLRCSLSTPVTLSGSLSTPTSASCSSSSDGASNSINSAAGPPLCPYGKKCTYGNKCKYLHPERGSMPHKTVTEKLAEKAHKRIQEVKARQQLQLLKPAVVRGESSPVGSSVKQPMMKSKPEAAPLRKTPLSRTISGVRMVEKSKSVDNFSVSSVLPESCYYPSPPSPPGFSSPPSSPPPCSSSSPFVPVTTASRQAARFNVGPRLSDPSAGSGGGGFGGHKKLQRQLTLNPEYDPRLLQMKGSSGGLPTPPPLIDDPDFYVKNPPPAFPVQQSSAAKQQSSLLQQQMFQHHQVSRIASAPDSGNLQQHSAGLPSLGPRSSTSDSNLNLGEDLGLLSPVSSSASSAASIVAPLSPPQGGCKYGPISPPQRAQQPQHRQVEFRGSLPPQPSETFQQDQEYRRYKIYFHLSHLFPEEQVRAAMRACPNETSPDRICAYIISLSSNSDN